MKILIDTQCWLWLRSAPERLSRKAERLIGEAQNTIYLSAASSWEIAIKFGLGKLRLPEPPSQFVPKRMAADGFFSLPIEHVHALQVATLPQHHRDPFDRILIAQALIEKMPILTSDRQFTLYDVEIVWED